MQHPLRSPLVSMLALLLACSHLQAPCMSESLVEAPSRPFLPSVALQSECPRMRIAIINGVSFHFEVLAGLLHVLKPYAKHVDVYMSSWVRKENYDGAWDLVRWSKATFRKTNMNIRGLGLDYGLAILVSTDYELDLNRKLLQQMQPRSTLAIVHNADFSDMPSLLNMTPNLRLLALAPHVAASLSRAAGRPADWLLPVYPVRPEPDCASELAPSQLTGLCLRGFAMQGKFSNLRRNYTAVWSQMAASLGTLADPQVGKVFHMYVLGKGPDRLRLPPELQTHVTVHRRLPYRGFYLVICHTLALVPSLANPRYYTDKFSSTIITSLSTGTPIIATQRLLEAYSFLSTEAVFVQENSEQEMDAMVRISATPAEQIAAVRAKLRELRQDLNARSFKLLEGFIREECTNGGSQVAARTIS